MAAQIGYRSVYWTIDTLNWQTTATPDSITKTVMAHIGNGVIILMYAGSQVESDTLDELMTKIEQMNLPNGHGDTGGRLSLQWPPHDRSMSSCATSCAGGPGA